MPELVHLSTGTPLSHKPEEYSQEYSELDVDKEAFTSGAANQTLYRDTGTQTDSFLLRNYLAHDKQWPSKMQGETMNKLQYANELQDVEHFPPPLSNDNGADTLELRQELMQKQMNKLQLMERDIDRENEMRLVCIQRSIENRKAMDEHNIHKKIDALNKDRTKLHSQLQVRNLKKQANTNRRLLEGRENVIKSLCTPHDVMNVFGANNTARKRQPDRMEPPSQQHRFKNNVEKSQLDQLSLILLRNRQEQKNKQYQVRGRNVSLSAPLWQAQNDDQDSSKIAEQHKDKEFV